MNKLEQTTCKRCGRKLKTRKAIEIGMGDVCWRKYKNENISLSKIECNNWKEVCNIKYKI